MTPAQYAVCTALLFVPLLAIVWSAVQLRTLSTQPAGVRRTQRLLAALTTMLIAGVLLGYIQTLLQLRA